MTVSTTRLLTLLAATVALAGCGTSHLTAAPRTTAAVTAQSTGLGLAATALKEDPNDPTHAAMNAIVADVLKGMFAVVVAASDTNHDGAISAQEYAAGHSAEAAALFAATFDTNKDGVVTQAEYDAAAGTDAAVMAYHHFTEGTMEKAIAPYLADKSFTVAEIRTYLVHDLAITGDWPMIFKLTKKLDLNNDGSVLHGPGEGPAFMLTFARQTLQHALGLPVSPLNLDSVANAK